MKTIFLTIISALIFLNLSAVTTYTVTKYTDVDPYKYPYYFDDVKCAPEMYGTLQWAIRKSMDTPGECLIDFNIPGTGPFTILLLYTLPTIEKEPIVIDATTQPGYSAGNPQIILDGRFSLLTGLYFNNIKNSGVKGIYFMHFISQAVMFNYSSQYFVTDCFFTENGSPESKIFPAAIRTSYSNNGIITGNMIGIDPAGNVTGNDALGIVLSDNSLNNVIGGTTNNEGNIIAQNQKIGIWVTKGSTNNKLSGNIIYGQDRAISLEPDGNNLMKVPVIKKYSTGVLQGVSEPNDFIEIFGSTGNENANEYLGTTQADVNGDWIASNISTTFDYFVATATSPGNNNTSGLSQVFQNIKNLNCPPPSNCDLINNEYFDIFNVPQPWVIPYSYSPFMHDYVCAWEAAWGSPQIASPSDAYILSEYGSNQGRGECIRQDIDLWANRIYHLDMEYQAYGNITGSPLMYTLISSSNFLDPDPTQGTVYTNYLNSFNSQLNAGTAVGIIQPLSIGTQTYTDYDLQIPAGMDANNYIYIFPHQSNNYGDLRLEVRRVQIHLPYPEMTATVDGICGNELTVENNTPHHDFNTQYNLTWIIEDESGNLLYSGNDESVTVTGNIGEWIHVQMIYEYQSNSGSHENPCFEDQYFELTGPNPVSVNINANGFCQGENFDFSVSITPNDPNYTYEYQWDIDNDGSIEGNGSNWSYLFNQPGYHPVKVIVTNTTCGNVQTAVKYVYVAPQNDSQDINTNCCVNDFIWTPDVDLDFPGITNWNTTGQIERIKGTLFIGAGHTLNISNGVVVSFGPQGKIIIAPGGTLNVSGNSLLTGTCTNRWSSSREEELSPPECLCKNMWEGIRVLGTNGTPHYPFSYFNPQITGRLIINGATIQDAHIAVMLGDAIFPYNTTNDPYSPIGRNGYIDVNNCRFVNNGIDIKFLAFEPPANAPYSKRINISRIRNCEFVTNYNKVIDKGYKTGNSYTYPNQFNLYYGFCNLQGRTSEGIELWGQIIHPPFYLTNNRFDNVQEGIVSHNSSYNVSNSTFIDVNKGIMINNQNSSLDYSKHSIINNTFKTASDIGIECICTMYDYIKGNTFGDINVYQAYNPISISLNSTIDIKIVDNTFNHVEKGIKANTVNNGFNLIGFETQGNYFNNNWTYLYAIGSNLGLQTKCNNANNLAASDYSNFNWNIQNQMADQGSPYNPSSTFNENTKYPAGNYFDPLSRKQIKATSFPSFNYYRHLNPSSRIPDILTPSTITLIPPVNSSTGSVNFDMVSPANSCLFSSSGNDDPSINITAFHNELAIIQQYQNQYNSLMSQVDRGETNYLLSIVNSMDPGQLKNTLLSHFPLSDTVIVATVYKNNPLAPGLLKEVLINNSPVSKKTWQQIYDVVDELPSGISSQIKNAQGNNATITTLTTLQRQIDAHNTKSKQLVQDIVWAYLSADSVQTAIDFLKTVPFTYTSMAVTSTLAEDSSTLAEATARLNAFVPSNEAEQDWKTITGIYINLKQENKSIFEIDSVQLSFVWIVAQREEYSLAVGNARSILYQLYGIEFPDNIENNETRMMAQKEVNKQEMETEQYSVFPNPAPGRLTITSKNPFGENTMVCFIDAMGKIVYQNNIPANITEFNITFLLSNGVYLCRIYQDYDQLFEKTIIVKK